MKKIYISIVIATLFNVSFAQNSIDETIGKTSETFRADDVPAGDAGRYYIPGSAAGKDSIKPSSYSKTFRAGINFNPTWNNSCGDMDFFTNYKAELKRMEYQLKNSIKKAEAAAMSIVSSVVTGFQQYLLGKINPTLNQLSLKNLDKYIEVFEVNVKKCEDYELDVKNGKNPLSEIAQIAVGDQWKTTIGLVNEGAISLEEGKETLNEEARKRGVTLADGENYGGKDQEPINVTKSITKAGMNLLLARGDKGQWDSDFSTSDKSMSDNPILGEFKNVKEMYEFIEEIYGVSEKTIDDSATGESVKTIAGKGYEKKYAEYRNDYLKLIRGYVNREIERNEFEKKGKVIIPPAEIQDIRELPPYQRSVEIEERSQQLAIKRIKGNLMFAKQVLKTGIQAPDMQQSSMKGIATEEYKQIYYRIQDDIVEIGRRAYQY